MWVKVHDRIESGEMPPKKKARPAAKDAAAVTKWLRDSLVAAEQAGMKDGRTRIRRLTRGEYENTMRDLFDLPGLALAGELPPDGSAHGFDNNSDALDISHVNLAKYVEAADKALDLAIATQPQAPEVRKARLSLAQAGGFVAHVLLHGDGVLLRDKKPDPEFPPAGAQEHLDEGAHERMGTFERGSTVGLFWPEDESFSPYFAAQVTIYPGRYRVRTSLWSFQWDKGQVLPSRGTETARLSVVQLTGDGRGGQHPSCVLGYFDAPSLDSKEHEVAVWMNHNEIIGFNTATLSPAETRGKLRAMGSTVPAIACDWLDLEGPLHDVWPPRSHRALFGELPLAEWKADANPGVRAPLRKTVRQIGAGKNRPDPAKGLWTVRSDQPLVDADTLLAAFLPTAFRRPVAEELRKAYVAKVEERLKAGDCFESAMRWAYRAALCSPDYLHHVEPDAKLDDHALACRLSYFLWNSMPDARLTELAASGKLRAALHDEIERMLKDAKSQRFVEDFCGQWLKLRAIAANDPDKKLYPEFSPYLQDSMVAETRAYLREMMEKNLDASHLVRSDFAMLNEKLALHYGIPGVTGAQLRRVALPPDCPRGGFLTQGAILKVTTNGTTTSPVPRGAFVMARLLGQPPEPPPPNTPAVEPDMRGATTIREQLDKHRADASCAACHAKLDPPGFALESFDVLGGFRDRYRAMRADGSMNKDGPAVDASGMLPDERKFSGIRDFQSLLAADPRLLKNLAEQLATYATGRPLAFSDRAEIAAIVARTQQQGGGLRTLTARFPLPWSHYVKLLTVKDENARRFYEAEALRGGWSVRQLDRQIGSLFYQRTLLSKDKAAMLRKGAKPQPGDTLSVDEAMRDPLVLEFLNLRDEYSETDLEDALVRHLETFLLELGGDFTFVGRQRRLLVGGAWYRVDLIFFHRRLRCLVIIDLKLGTLDHADAGQMHLYLSYACEHWTHEGENPPVGIILCSSADAALARYTLDTLPNKVMAREYQLALPAVKKLEAELAATRKRLERAGKKPSHPDK